jgi:hypothetical protein
MLPPTPLLLLLSLFPQVADLSRLVCLEVVDIAVEAAPSLAHLSSLRRLRMARCAMLPAWLAELTQLEHLQLSGARLDEEGLQEALSPLRRLRSLALHLDDSRGEAAPPDPPLPASPWLRNLRQLAVSTTTLVGSAALLPGAASLRQLRVLHGPWTVEDSKMEGEEESWLAVCSWLRTHPSLAIVQLVADLEALLAPFLLSSLLDLKAHRPQVHVSSMSGTLSVRRCFPEWFSASHARGALHRAAPRRTSRYQLASALLISS